MSYNFNWSAISGGAPYITVSSLGIAFNSASIAKLESPDKVLVGFDEEKCAIGIRAYQGERGIRAYPFAERVKNGWVRIGCRDFIKYLQSISGVDFSTARRYIARFDAKERTLIILVREAQENSGSEQMEK